MNKLKDIKGEEALDVLCDLMSPISEIMSDKIIAQMIRSKKRIEAVTYAIKNHKKAVIEALAIIEGEDPEDYVNKISVLTLPSRLLEILNEPELTQLFTLQGQKDSGASSGSATENTEDEEI